MGKSIAIQRKRGRLCVSLVAVIAVAGTASSSALGLSGVSGEITQASVNAAFTHVRVIGSVTAPYNESTLGSSTSAPSEWSVRGEAFVKPADLECSGPHLLRAGPDGTHVWSETVVAPPPPHEGPTHTVAFTKRSRLFSQESFFGVGGVLCLAAYGTWYSSVRSPACSPEVAVLLPGTCHESVPGQEAALLAEAPLEVLPPTGRERRLCSKARRTINRLEVRIRRAQEHSIGRRKLQRLRFLQIRANGRAVTWCPKIPGA